MSLKENAIDLLLDETTWDLADLVDGDLQLAGGPTDDEKRAGIVQALRQRLQLFLGEWFLDTTAGFPWFQDVLGEKAPDDVAIRAAIRRQCLLEPGVTEVLALDWSADRQARTASITVRVQTDVGELTVEASA